MNHHEEQQSLTLALNGSKAALEKLLRGYAPRLFVAACTEVRDPDLAEDLAVSTIEEGWHKFRKFRGATVYEFQSWLLQIMRWMACRARRQRRREVNCCEVPDAPMSSSQALVDQIAARQVLAALPYASMVCLWLKAVGLTAQEIADWLAMCDDPRLRSAFAAFPPNERAVNNNLEQARKRIRHLMESPVCADAERGWSK
jgi:DNA-directed RNA polymerase specialized sigma24 family protein